jgi:myo-inositol-1(or 4)-monophosphatase
VREAGGFVTDLDGRDAMLTTGGILAGNEAIQRDLLRVIKEVGKATAGINELSARSSA